MANFNKGKDKKTTYKHKSKSHNEDSAKSFIEQYIMSNNDSTIKLQD